jgi:hypothetical protein
MELKHCITNLSPSSSPHLSKHLCTLACMRLGDNVVCWYHFICVQRVARGWLKLQIYGALLRGVIYCSHPAWAVRVIGFSGMYCVPASSIDATYRFTTSHDVREKNVDTVGSFLK